MFGVMQRGQANLVALVVGVLLVGAAVTLAVGAGADAFARADRSPAEARLAASLADRLVSPRGPLAARENVVRADAVANATGDVCPATTACRVTVGDTTVAAAGTPAGGTTVRRIVVVADTHSQTRTGRATRLSGGGPALTLPRGTTTGSLTIRAPDCARVRTVRAGGRVILHAPRGLNGTYRVSPPGGEGTALSFTGRDCRPPQPVAAVVRVEAVRITEPAVMAVTVDA